MTKGTYTEKLPTICGDLIAIDVFRDDVAEGCFNDYDGFGHPVRGGRLDPQIVVLPSYMDRIPADATHVHWYNR